MTRRTPPTLRSTERAITRLVEEYRKGSPLYLRNPQVVAQVSRTAKWLLNALAALRRDLTNPTSKETAP